MKNETMFVDVFGYKVIVKKWFKLIDRVREKNLDSKYYLVKVVSGNLWATDGLQLVKLDVVDEDLDDGIFVLSKEGFMFPVVEFNGEYPDLAGNVDKKERDKSALIEGFNDNPLVAAAYIIKEFGFAINIDGHRKTLEAVAKLEPDYVRVWGFKENEKNKDIPIIFECIMPNEKRFTLVLDGIKKDLCVKVEKTLFDDKSRK